MNNARILELAGDNFFVIAAVVGSVAVVLWLLARINKKSKTRY